MLTSLSINAMKRLREDNNPNNSSKKTCLASAFPIKLPREMDQFIIDRIINNECKLRLCIKTIKAFVQTNKESYIFFNNQKYIDELIEKLSKKFFCSDATSAKTLCTPKANDRLDLQNNLFTLCTKIKSISNFTETFNRLIGKNVNVNFTYNYRHQPQTLLMIRHSWLARMRSKDKNFSCFPLLVEKANFNQKTSHNKTLLIKSVEFPIAYDIAEKIIKDKRIEINEQNNQGETALLRCIKNRKKNPMTSVFVKTIQKLLQYKSNPLLADKFGKTPLRAAYEINDLSEMRDMVIKFIQDSITKHMLSDPTNPQ